jgi:hypothetical protein
VFQAGAYDSAVNARLVFRATDASIRLLSYPSNATVNALGNFASSPGATTDINNKTVVAARDNFNGIWANAFDPGTQTWAGWQFGGGVVSGNPSVAAGADGRSWIAARDAYNSYWLLSYSPIGGFGAWVPLQGVFSTDPAIAACPDGSLYVVGKDNYNALWSGHYIPGVGLQGFQLGGGVVQGSPSITCGNDSAVYIAVRDNSNSNWMARVAGNTWTGWFNGGGVSSVDPKVAVTSGGVVVVTLDSGGAVWRNAFGQGFGNGWLPAWTSVGGILQDVSVSTANGEIFIAGRAPNQTLWWWRATGNLWTSGGNTGLVSDGLSATPH